MNSTCITCGYDVSHYEAEIEVNGRTQSFYCPVCGQGFGPVNGVPGRDVFYDSEQREFFKWSTPTEAAQPEIVVPLEISPKFKLLVRAKTLNYQKLFYEQALVFVLDGEISTNQLFAPPDKHERYGIVITDRRLDQTDSFIDLHFELKGGARPFFLSLPATVTRATTDLQSRQVSNGSALTVWPNFKRRPEAGAANYPAWRDYFVQFATDDQGTKVETLRVVGERPGEQITFDGARPKGALDFPPKYIEVKATVTRPGQPPRQYRNSFEVSLQSFPPQTTANINKTLRVAIDFGTSNTCVCYVVPGDGGGADNNAYTPQLMELHNKSYEVVRGLQFGASSERLWLPEPEAHGQKFVPSELVFRADPTRMLSQPSPPEPILDYTIPGLHWRQGEESKICTGFKWKHATEPAAVRNSYQKLQRMYLDLLLRMVIADLVSGNGQLTGAEVNAHKVELIYTYPLAMEKDEREGLKKAFEDVARGVHARTGVEIIVQVGIDESRAGEAGIKMQAEGQRIFVDIGGGTTDIAVIEQRENVANRQLLLVDSMRYAGNDYLAALSHDTGGGSISTSPLVELQRRVRSERHEALKDMSIFGGSAANKVEAQAALESFFRGVMQYLARLVVLRVNAREGGEAGASGKIQLYLLGNGWNFVLVLPRWRGVLANPNDAQKFVMHEEVERRLHKELDKFSQGGFFTVAPPGKWADLIELNFPQEPKTAVARGALEVTQRRIDDLSKQFVGCDIEVVTTMGVKAFRWDTQIPQSLGVEIERVSITNPIGGFEEIEVPDYQYDSAPRVDLKDIDIKRWVCDGRDGLVSCALNAYLERWHKKHLTGDWATPSQG